MNLVTWIAVAAMLLLTAQQTVLLVLYLRQRNGSTLHDLTREEFNAIMDSNRRRLRNGFAGTDGQLSELRQILHATPRGGKDG